MKPVKVTGNSRAKVEGRRINRINFKELEKTKSGETSYEYSTNSCLDRKSKREIKRERHYKLIEKLKFQLSSVQDEIEKSCFDLTSNLECAIDKDFEIIEEKLQCVKDGKIEQTDIKITLNKICEDATKVSSRRKDATETLYKMLLNVEENRSKRIAVILDEFRQLFAENDYLDKKEIKAFFDFELMNVNDGTLRNISYYSGLRDQCHESTDECLNSLKSLCSQKIAFWEESLTSNLQSELKMAANFNLNETPLHSKQWSNLQLSFDSELEKLIENWNLLELILTNQKNCQSWFEALERNLESLDYIAHDLLQECESFLEKKYADCESNVHKVLISCSSEATALFQPKLKALKDQTETTAFNLKVVWGELIFNLLEEIDSIKGIFGAAEDFKRKYNESLVNLQSQTYSQMFSEKEDSTSRVGKEEESHLEELVIRVKSALNAETASSLMAEVDNIYNGKKIQLQDKYNKTKKNFDTFLETFKDELNGVRNEINISVSFFEKRMDNFLAVDISHLQVGNPVFLQSTQKQLKRIQESRVRILSLLPSEFATMLENDCTERAKVWTLSKRQMVRKNFENEMSSLSSWWAHFESVVYAPRLQQIREHADYFNECKQTLKDFVPEIEVTTSETLTRLNEVNRELNTWIESIKKRSFAVCKSRAVQSILSEVVEKEVEFRRSLRNLSSKYIETMNAMEEAVINKNFDLVQHLLSLEEQNAYTNEEIAVFCDEFFKLEKEIISKSQKLRENALKRNCSTVDEYQQRLSLLIESLKQHEADLSFTETVVKFVRKSITEIKKHAFLMKRSGKELTQQITELTQVVATFAMWPESTETVILERWKLLFRSLESRATLLFNPFEVNAGNLDDEFNNSIMFSSNINMEVNFSSSTNSFLCKVHNILRKSVMHIEEVAKNYYTRNTSRMTKLPEQVHESHNELMTEIMQKCHKYVQQCQLEWFKEVRDFVNTVALFKEGINSYVVRFVSNLRETFVEIMNMHEKDATRALMTIQDNGSKWIREILTSLKPSHGLPENEQLVNKLKIQFDNACSKYELMFEENVKKYTSNAEKILENASKDLRFKVGVLRSALHDMFDGNILRSVIYGLKKEFENSLGPRSSRNSEQRCVTLHEPCPHGNHYDLDVKWVPVRRIDVIDELQIESTRLKLIALAEEEGSRETLYDQIEDESINQFLQMLREIAARTSKKLTKMDSAFKSSIKEARFEWEINVHSIESMYTLPTN